jgi:thiamine-monophosphate kinase
MEDFGEKDFLARLLPDLTAHPSFLNGFGDDASAISIGGERVVMFKIDRAASPIAAKRGWVDYQMWGRLAVTSNCSDILAGGGAPIAVMIAMILPRDWSAEAAVQVITGCAEECAAQDIAFAGGDTKEGRSAELVGSAIGLSRPDKVLTRRRARPGDRIVLAGRLGGFLGAYLQLLEADRPGGLAAQPRSERWLEYVSHPRARWQEGAFMRDSLVATGAMDTSDGLYDAVATLTAGYGADLALPALPYHDIAHECGANLGIPLLNLGLGVGDWNIVYTVDAERWRECGDKVDGGDLELTVIGEVTERPGIRWHDESDAQFTCQPIVNQHFRARLEDEDTLVTRLREEQMLTPVAR